jgi:hypothetical protein
MPNKIISNLSYVIIDNFLLLEWFIILLLLIKLLDWFGSFVSSCTKDVLNLEFIKTLQFLSLSKGSKVYFSSAFAISLGRLCLTNWFRSRTQLFEHVYLQPSLNTRCLA